MDKIQEAFRKIKQDILFLNEEIKILKENMTDLTNILKENNLKKTQYNNRDNSAFRHINKTNPTNLTTHNYSLKPLNNQNLTISTGNQGVTTDRQTDRQTDQHTSLSYGNLKNLSYGGPGDFPHRNSKDSMESDLEILNSLDNIKKGIRLKFKALTEKEFIIFSTIYQLEEELGHTDYKTLSENLSLTESSIRDYVGRLINKGIPVEKNKINNKNIQLKISDNLRKIAPLNTIFQLRDI